MLCNGIRRHQHDPAVAQASGGEGRGLIAGRKELIQKIRKHPLKRALRVGKEVFAAMEVVVRLYLDPDRLAQRLPTLRLLTRAQSDIAAQAERLLPAFQTAFAGAAHVTVAACASRIGSGALPVESLPSAAIAVRPPHSGKGEGRWLTALSAQLRALPVPVIGRVTENMLFLDLRTLEDEYVLLAQLSSLPADPI